MNTRIKFFCILIAICYVGLFVNMFCNGLDDIKESFMEGAGSAYSETDVKTLNVWLAPIEKGSTAITLSDKTYNKALNTRLKGSMVKVDVPSKDIPGHLFAIEIVCIITGAFLAIAFIAFPFLFFNVVYSITKNKIVTESVIIKIRIMGWIMTIFFLLDALLRYVNIETAKHVINTGNYKIAGLDLEDNIIYLCLGLVTLLLAEILKVSLNLKEEQDLTI